MSKDYWIIEDFDAESTNNLVCFLKEQASYLEDRTKGNVLAVYTKLRQNSIARTVEMVGQVMGAVSGPKRTPGAEDASDLYRRFRYEYFITDKRKHYELGLFDLFIGDSYPVHMCNIDSTIVSEAGLETTYDFNSLDQFQEVYEKIIATRKVRFIISRLIRLMEEQDEQEAQNELLAQNESIESED